MNREKKLILAVLELLDQAWPYAVPEGQLRTELEKQVRPPASLDEFTAVLQGLAERGLVRRQADLVDPKATTWIITETGKNLRAL